MAAEHIKFYMDEHVPRVVTDGLRRLGIDVLMAQDVGLVQTADEDHLAFALNTDRVMVTQDDDFLGLDARGHSHKGIVYVPQRTSIGAFVRGLSLIHDVFTSDDMVGRVEFV